MSRPWHAYRAQEVMKGPVRTIYSDESLKTAVDLLTDQGISALVVVTGVGQPKPVGVVTLTDVAAFLAGLAREEGDDEGAAYDLDTRGWTLSRAEQSEALLEDTLVADVMTARLLAVAPDDLVVDAIELMRVHQVHRILVQEGDEVVGLVSTLDVFEILHREAQALRARGELPPSSVGA